MAAGTKRFSFFWGFNESKTQPKVSHEEIRVEEDRMKERTFSLLSGFSSYQSPFPNNESEIVVSGKAEVGAKRSRRFSLFSTTSPDDNDEFPLSGGQKPTNSGREQDDIVTMIFKLFHAGPSRKSQASKLEGNVSTRSSVSSKPQVRKAKTKNQNRIKVTANIGPFWKPRKEAKVVKEADTASLTPTVVRKSLKGRKHKRANSVCDSKFSSVSSTISFTSLPHELVALTLPQVTILLSLTRKLGRSLQKQEHLTSNFSVNLAYLFARKEMIIAGNKRLGKELRKMLMAMMAGLRDLVGRTFLKKAVFLQRSSGLVHDLTTMLENGLPDITMKTQEDNDSETTLVPSAQDEQEQRISVIAEEFNTLAISLARPEPSRQLDIHYFQHTLTILREDIGVQQQLDAALRAGIVGPCEDERFPATVSERIAMKRFVAFVDGCLWRVGRCYGQEARVAKALEVLGGVLKEEEGW